MLLLKLGISKITGLTLKLICSSSTHRKLNYRFVSGSHSAASAYSIQISRHPYFVAADWLSLVGQAWRWLYQTMIQSLGSFSVFFIFILSFISIERMKLAVLKLWNLAVAPRWISVFLLYVFREPHRVTQYEFYHYYLVVKASLPLHSYPKESPF